MPAKRINLENLKPLTKAPRVERRGGRIEFSTALNDKVSSFQPEAERYLRYFSQAMSVHEIVQFENAKLQRVNFTLLKEIFSQLYWNDHLTNKIEYKKAIEESEGQPAFDGLLADPIVDLSLDDSTNPALFLIPILLSALAVKLLMRPDPPAFFILFFPQIFLTAKGLLSFAASRLLFKSQEPMSLHFSLFGIYYKLSAGRRSSVSQPQFLTHAFILVVLSSLSLVYFHNASEAVFTDFGPLVTALMFVLNFSPVHNSDLSNLRFRIQINQRRRLGLNLQEDVGDKMSKMIFRVSALVFNVIAVGFIAFCLFNSVVLAGRRNYVPLIYQIIFDVAAFALFFDLVEQFDKALPGARNFSSRHWVSRFKSSLKKYRTNKDLSVLIRAIPIFEGLPEDVFAQMVQTSKVITLGTGSRVCKDGDLTTDLYVVIEGQVGIYKQDKKIIEINEGSLFGEGGFLLGRPRMGSAYCQSKCVLLVIKRPKAFASTNRTQEKNLTQFQKKIWSFQALTQSSFFKDLPSEAVMQLINQGEVIELAARAVVIRQGDVSDSLWVIIQGKCQASVEGQKIREMNAKDVFGEIGIIWNSPRTSTVTTLEPSIFLRIHAHHLWSLLSQNLNIAVSLQNLGEYRLNSQTLAAEPS